MYIFKETDVSEEDPIPIIHEATLLQQRIEDKLEIVESKAKTAKLGQQLGLNQKVHLLKYHRNNKQRTVTKLLGKDIPDQFVQYKSNQDYFLYTIGQLIGLYSFKTRSIREIYLDMKYDSAMILNVYLSAIHKERILVTFRDQGAVSIDFSLYSQCQENIKFSRENSYESQVLMWYAEDSVSIYLPDTNMESIYIFSKKTKQHQAAHFPTIMVQLIVTQSGKIFFMSLDQKYYALEYKSKQEIQDMRQQAQASEHFRKASQQDQQKYIKYIGMFSQLSMSTHYKDTSEQSQPSKTFKSPRSIYQYQIYSNEYVPESTILFQLSFDDQKQLIKEELEPLIWNTSGSKVTREDLKSNWVIKSLMVAGSFFLKLAVRYLEQQDPLSLVKLVDALDSYSGDMTATFYKPFSLSIVCEAIGGCLSVVQTRSILLEMKGRTQDQALQHLTKTLVSSEIKELLTILSKVAIPPIVLAHIVVNHCQMKIKYNVWLITKLMESNQLSKVKLRQFCSVLSSYLQHFVQLAEEDSGTSDEDFILQLIEAVEEAPVLDGFNVAKEVFSLANLI